MITDHIYFWAERTPDKVALRYNGEDVTYRTFAEQIRLARTFFVRHGYDGAGIVIIAIRNISHFWIASLALRSLGVTTFAVSAAEGVEQPGLPGVRGVVATTLGDWTGLAERCDALRLPLLRLAFGGEQRLVPDTAPGVPGGHILQTSGTTGTSKKLMIDPVTEDDYHKKRRDLLGIDHTTVFQLFDFAPWVGAGYKTPMTVWPVGGAVSIQQTPKLYEGLREPDLTHTVLVPHMLPRLLGTEDDAFPRNERMQVSLTGGPVTQGEIVEVKRRISPIVYNRLSSTEVGIFGMTRLDFPEDQRWHRPVRGRTVEAVDDRDRPVPVGVQGRLRVSIEDGPSSYFNEPEASKTFFRKGYFYTGDLAIFREDGRFALQGRATDVINLRGAKVSPAPIEDRLREALGANGICLVTLQNDLGEELLHVVVESSQRLDQPKIAQLLAEEVGLVPYRLTRVRELPRTNTGKVKRSAVREKLLDLGAAEA